MPSRFDRTLVKSTQEFSLFQPFCACSRLFFTREKPKTIAKSKKQLEPGLAKKRGVQTADSNRFCKLTLKDRLDNQNMRVKFDSRRRTRSKAKASQEALSQAELEMKGEVAVNSKAKPKKNHTIKFCPKCGSDQVFWAQGLPQLWSLWQCRKCGYRGPVILEDGEVAQKDLEKWKKQERPPLKGV